MNLITRFITEDEGGQTVEYALVLTLIAIAAIVGLGFAGNAINNWWQAIGNYLDTLTTSIPT